MAQDVEISPRGGKGLVYVAYSVPWLLIIRRRSSEAMTSVTTIFTQFFRNIQISELSGRKGTPTCLKKTAIESCQLVVIDQYLSDISL